MAVYRLLSIVALSALVAACSSTPDCLKPQVYEKAKSYPKLQLPPGLEAADSQNALQVPDAGPGPIGQFATAPANSDPEDPAARCLTTPPPLPKSQLDMSRQASS